LTISLEILPLKLIKNVKMEDRGSYMCQVNTDPMKMQTAYLEVVIPPDIVYEETSGGE
jgi:neurotrimin